MREQLSSRQIFIDQRHFLYEPGKSHNQRLAALYDDSRMDTSHIKRALAETSVWRRERKIFHRGAGRRRKALLEAGWGAVDSARRHAEETLQVLHRKRQFELEDSAATKIQRAVRQFLARRREMRELELKLTASKALPLPGASRERPASGRTASGRSHTPERTARLDQQPSRSSSATMSVKGAESVAEAGVV